MSDQSVSDLLLLQGRGLEVACREREGNVGWRRGGGGREWKLDLLGNAIDIEGVSDWPINAAGRGAGGGEGNNAPKAIA